MTIQAYNLKAIVSGNIIEFYRYQDTMFKGYENKKTGSGSSDDYYDSDGNRMTIDPDTGEMIPKVLESRARSNIRARNTIRRLALANFNNNSKFITLTFGDHITDIEQANKYFKAFIRKMTRKQNGFKYLAVIEFTKIGRIHYHMLCNMDYMKAKDIETMWGQGFIKINRITHVDNIGAYVVKYMTKDDADERLIGKKMYQRSRGMDEPKELVGAQAEYIMAQLEKEGKKIVYSSKYENRQTGNNIEYMEYNMKR
ncbi:MULTISPECIES: Rep protein [unclassified Priestia]|uniref:rolling circle replication-associated protein n=1 Tax=unclassified Priestia TaxID=2800374 RepID=UPI00366C4F0B